MKLISVLKLVPVLALLGSSAFAKSSAQRASDYQKAANKSQSQGMKGTAAQQQRMADFNQRKADREARKK